VFQRSDRRRASLRVRIYLATGIGLWSLRPWVIWTQWKHRHYYQRSVRNAAGSYATGCDGAIDRLTESPIRLVATTQTNVYPVHELHSLYQHLAKHIQTTERNDLNRIQQFLTGGTSRFYERQTVFFTVMNSQLQKPEAHRLPTARLADGVRAAQLTLRDLEPGYVALRIALIPDDAEQELVIRAYRSCPHYRARWALGPRSVSFQSSSNQLEDEAQKALAHDLVRLCATSLWPDGLGLLPSGEYPFGLVLYWSRAVNAFDLHNDSIIHRVLNCNWHDYNADDEKALFFGVPGDADPVSANLSWLLFGAVAEDHRELLQALDESQESLLPWMALWRAAQMLRTEQMRFQTRVAAMWSGHFKWLRRRKLGRLLAELQVARFVLSKLDSLHEIRSASEDDHLPADHGRWLNSMRHNRLGQMPGEEFDLTALLRWVWGEFDKQVHLAIQDENVTEQAVGQLLQLRSGRIAQYVSVASLVVAVAALVVAALTAWLAYLTLNPPPPTVHLGGQPATGIHRQG
jgi:hypothetical protein